MNLKILGKFKILLYGVWWFEIRWNFRGECPVSLKVTVKAIAGNHWFPVYGNARNGIEWNPNGISCIQFVTSGTYIAFVGCGFSFCKCSFFFSLSLFSLCVTIDPELLQNIILKKGFFWFKGKFFLFSKLR